MKYTTYCEDSRVIMERQLGQAMKNIEKEKVLSEFEFAVVRKLAFEPADPSCGGGNDAADRPVYSLCMKNFDEERLYLEKKIVQNNIVYKSFASITKDEAKKILAGDVTWMQTHAAALFQDFYRQYTLNGLRHGYITQSEKEIRSYRDKSCLVVNRAVKRASLWKEDFFDPEAELFEGQSCDKARLQYKRPVTIPLAIANIVHTSSEQCSRLAYSL